MSSARSTGEGAPQVEGLWSATPAPAPAAVEDVPSLMRSLLSPDAPSLDEAERRAQLAEDSHVRRADPSESSDVDDSIRQLLAGFDGEGESPEAELGAEAIVLEEPTSAHDSGLRDSGDFLALHSGEIEIVGLTAEAMRRTPRAAPMPPEPTVRRTAAQPEPLEKAPPEQAAIASPVGLEPEGTPAEPIVPAESLLAVVDAAIDPSVPEAVLEPVADEPSRAKKVRAKKKASAKKKKKRKKSKVAALPEPRGDLADSWAHQEPPAPPSARVDLEPIVHRLAPPAATAPISSLPGPAPLPSTGAPATEAPRGWDLPSGGVGFSLGLAVAAAFYLFVLRPTPAAEPLAEASASSSSLRVASALPARLDPDRAAVDPAPVDPAPVEPAPVVPEQQGIESADLDLEPADLTVAEVRAPHVPAASTTPRRAARAARPAARPPEPTATPVPEVVQAAAEPAPEREPEATPEPEPIAVAEPEPTLEPVPAPVARPGRAEVEAAIMAEASSIRACAPDHHNHIASIRFTFGSTGRVMSAIVDSGFATPQARSCVARAARAVRVPSFSDGRLSVTYPMRF